MRADWFRTRGSMLSTPTYSIYHIHIIMFNFASPIDSGRRQTRGFPVRCMSPRAAPPRRASFLGISGSAFISIGFNQLFRLRLPVSAGWGRIGSSRDGARPTARVAMLVGSRVAILGGRPTFIEQRRAAMIEDQFIELIEPILREGGSVLEAGEEFREPPLDVLRYYPRIVRMHRVPILGRALGVAMVARQPVDIDGSTAGYGRLVNRLAMAVNGRFPPWKGLVIGLTAMILTPEPIGPGDDTMLRQVLDVKLRRMRVVPFGLIRINLGQEAIAMAINESPDGLFPEPARLADVLCERFRRFVPLIEV